jgi:Mn2+/Fe2+ NRAMP family transporter
MSSETEKAETTSSIPMPPRGLALFAVLGPGLIWASEYIGSGEVILATRAGAVLGLMVLWVPVMGILTKFWIGYAGAQYTVCTGEGMVDMMSRTPGPKNWVIWPVFVGQLVSGAIATGGLAASAGAFAQYFLPGVPPFLLGWVISIAVIAIVWSGEFNILKYIMSVLVLVIVIGVFDVARTTWPGWGTIIHGSFGFAVPPVPEWAQSESNLAASAWTEILPLLGWAAGGLASQVWYTYWILGAGYGMAHKRGYGEPMDESKLRTMTVETAQRVKGWQKVVRADAALALLLGIVVTVGFMMAGAGILRPAEIAPEGDKVAFELANVFSAKWGDIGAKLFVLAGFAALVSTLLGQFAGWPRLLADCARLTIPAVAKYPWKVQFRAVLILYAFTSLIIVFSFGLKPVLLVKLGAILDGLILTPLQAVSAGLVLFFVMPKFFPKDVAKILKPSPIIAIGLLAAFALFGSIAVMKTPGAIKELVFPPQQESAETQEEAEDLAASLDQYKYAPQQHNLFLLAKRSHPLECGDTSPLWLPSGTTPLRNF